MSSTRSHSRRLLALLLLVPLLACGKPADAPAPASTPAADTATLAVPPTAALDALNGFEGELDFVVKSGKPDAVPHAVAIQVKGSKLRFDLPEGVGPTQALSKNVHVVIDTAEKRAFAVLEEKKQVIVVNLETMSEQLKSMRPAGSPEDKDKAAPPKITKTGHMDNVAGRACEDWQVEMAKGEKGTICVASEGAAWFKLPTIGLPTEHAWARELFDGQHLPLRAIGYDASGAESGRMELTKLDKKSIPDAAFAIPADYKTLDLAQMMSGLMGAAMAFGSAPQGTTGTPGAMPKMTPEQLKNMQQMMKRMPPNVRAMMEKRMQQQQQQK